VKIGAVDLDRDVYVIAEIGGNHNGDAATAYALVEAAAKAGANAVKFQTYDADTLVHPSTEPLPIVRKSYATQLARFKSLELDAQVYDRIFELCAEHSIDFITTPFDLEILDWMAPHMPAIKIASGDLTYDQLIKAAAATGKPVIISTGMANVEEISKVATLVPHQRLSLLHCVSIYPLPDNLANLRSIETMRQLWPDITIGYSDHTKGIEAAVAAVAMGARIVEKHFTLDKRQTPGDHALSVEPAELAELMRWVRRLQPMLGTGEKVPAAGEESMRNWMRRGIYAAHALPQGHAITSEDLLMIRPLTPLDPGQADLLIGRRLARAVESFAAIDVGMLA